MNKVRFFRTSLEKYQYIQKTVDDMFRDVINTGICQHILPEINYTFKDGNVYVALSEEMVSPPELQPLLQLVEEIDEPTYRQAEDAESI